MNPPPGSLAGLLWREMPISTAFFYTSPDLKTSHVSLKVPGKGAPPPCFPNEASMERNAPSPEPMVYSFIYNSESPQLRSSPTKNGGKIQSPSTQPHMDRGPTYSGVCPGSPRGSFMTLLSLPYCHAALSTIPSTLAWVDQSPVGHHVS